jgi:ribokinase
LQLVDILVPNEIEVGLLSGMPVSDIESAERAARSLFTSGIKEVVVTLGGKGALLVSSTHEPSFHIHAYPVKVVDTTAAGDAFMAGMAVALGEGMSLHDAVQLGNAAGALAVTRLGAQPSLPTRQEVNLFLGRLA